MSSSSLHIANEAVMAKKKTSKEQGDERVCLKLRTGMTRDEVWRAYREACQEVHEVTEEDFVEMMRPVSPFLHAQHACIIQEVWTEVYHSHRLADLLYIRKGRRKGQLHYYNLLNIMEVIIGMEDSLFTVGTSVSDVCHVLHIPDNYNHGRTSYSLEEEQEKELQRIVRRMKRGRKMTNGV